jgi:hypothetical protein
LTFEDMVSMSVWDCFAVWDIRFSLRFR